MTRAQAIALASRRALTAISPASRAGAFDALADGNGKVGNQGLELGKVLRAGRDDAVFHDTDADAGGFFASCCASLPEPICPGG